MDLTGAAREVMEAAWRPAGYTAPSPERYPWQWLWDSCFHALVWAALGVPERGAAEVARLLSFSSDDGFVPHVLYAPGESPHAAFWGRADASSITQPPMFGHAVAALDLGGDVRVAAVEAVQFLLERRARVDGLVALCHPWESGADDSPRWDHWYGTPWVADDVFRIKGTLLDAVERSPSGAPVANPAFRVGSVGFNALVAFNALELGLDDSGLVAALDGRWSGETWVDTGDAAATSGGIRTLDALLPLLVCPRDEAFDQLVDPDAFGGAFGPAGVHRAEPTFAPGSYWRGSAWPQLSYLLWVAARRAGRDDVAASIVESTVAAVAANGFAEHWHPDTGEGLGAVPQSWSCLAIVMTG